jgi:hypothetical protein
VNTTLRVALIAASVTVIGWMVNYLLSSNHERKRARLAAQLAHVEKQLAELYGPLAFLIYEGRATFEDLLQTVDRRYLFIDNKPLSDAEVRMWLFWVDEDLMPRNAAIQALLSSKSHLIDAENLPESYVAFLDHYNSWRVTHSRWTKQGVEYSWHSKVNWPSEFDADVLETFRRLKRTHAELTGAVARA